MGESKFEYVAGARAEPSQDAPFDVVFVHGLTGDHDGTWRHENGEYWPQWIATDFPDINVYSAGYSSSLLASLTKGAGASLSDRATILLDRLATRPTAGRPLVFITHSLGGLIVKMMMRKAEVASTMRKKNISQQTLGVVFIATPHAGAQVANAANAIARLATSKSVKELGYANDNLVELSTWFSGWANARELPVEAYYEVFKHSGALIVDAVTANPNVKGCDPVAIEADHVTITKLKTRDVQLYGSVRAFLQDLLRLAAEQEDDDGGDDQIRSEYSVYTTQAATDRRNLAEKLTSAGRAHEIPRAEAQKERFAMTLQRHIAQPAAVRRFTRLMSNLETRYHRHVGPLIAAGETEAVINGALQAAVLDPCLGALDADGGDGTSALVDSALYYLAGNCHIAWDHD